MDKSDIYVYLYDNFELFLLVKGGSEIVYVPTPYINSVDHPMYCNGFLIEGSFYSLDDGYDTVRFFWKHLVKKFNLNETYAILTCREYLRDYKNNTPAFRRILKIKDLL